MSAFGTFADVLDFSRHYPTGFPTSVLMFPNASFYSPSDSGRAVYRKTRCCAGRPCASRIRRPPSRARHLRGAQAARRWQNIEQRFADVRAYLQAYVRELLTELVAQMRADAAA
jgi:hypothetical protein